MKSFPSTPETKINFVFNLAFERCGTDVISGLPSANPSLSYSFSFLDLCLVDHILIEATGPRIERKTDLGLCVIFSVGLNSFFV